MGLYGITAFLAAGILLGTTPFAGAATHCTAIVSNTTIDDDLVVPSGKSCDLENVLVLRNVYVDRGATLEAQFLSAGSTKIFGNLIAVNCGFVALGEQVNIGGNVLIKGCTGPSNQSLGSTNINGNFACIANKTSCGISNSAVTGNAQIDENAEGAFVTNNDIGGNLQCLGNAASGLSVSRNSVAGNKEGQCAHDTASPGN